MDVEGHGNGKAELFVRGAVMYERVDCFGERSSARWWPREISGNGASVGLQNSVAYSRGRF